MSDPHLELAERLLAAIVAADFEAVRGVYAPDAVVWHNYDGIAQSLDENLRVLRWVVRNVSELRYEDVRRLRTPEGFVQQHVLRCKALDGTAIAIPACLIGTVRDGRIVRLEEYFDSAHAAPLSATRA